MKFYCIIIIKTITLLVAIVTIMALTLQTRSLCCY